MPRHLTDGLFAAMVLVLLTCSARATSIIALIEPDQIFLAADSRTMSGNFVAVADDRTCKIIWLTDVAFADSGINSVKHKDDNSVAWDAFIVAREVYREHTGSLFDLSTEWTTRSVAFWTPYFSHQVEDGENLLRQNGENVSSSVFAGLFDGRPRVMIGRAYIDRQEGPPRIPRPKIDILIPQAQPYTSNPITQELINGTTVRSKVAQAEWERKAKLIKPSDRRVRRLEFLIQETAKYDSHVDTTVNILKIGVNGKPKWMQSPTCR